MNKTFNKQKNELNGSLALGGIFLILFYIILPGLGVRFYGGLIDINLLFFFWIMMGMLSAYLAYKKNKNTRTALFVGIFFGPFSILYYILCKPEMTQKEKEIHEWELEKKYMQMKEEKNKQEK